MRPQYPQSQDLFLPPKQLRPRMGEFLMLEHDRDKRDLYLAGDGLPEKQSLATNPHSEASESDAPSQKYLLALYHKLDRYEQKVHGLG